MAHKYTTKLWKILTFKLAEASPRDGGFLVITTQPPSRWGRGASPALPVENGLLVFMLVSAYLCLLFDPLLKMDD